MRNPKVGEKWATLSHGFAVEGVPAIAPFK
jgi:hypothetical protein